MKKLILTLSIIITYSCLTAQTIVDMAGERDNLHYKNGNFYIKDVNNYMQPYVGTWQYTNGNEEFRITITKVEMYHTIDNDLNQNYYEDGLILSYQKYENGQLSYSSPANDYPLGIIKEFGKLRLTFTDYERVFKNEPLNASRNAGHKAHLDLIDNGNGGYNLKLKLFTEQEHPNLGIKYEPVNSGDPYHSTPTDIVMTKM